jgi:predicted transglutaminase-like cysteine proteinase
VLIIDALQVHLDRKANASLRIAERLAQIFDYVRDQDRFGEPDNWPTRDEVAANIATHGGRLVGDCDDHAFAAAYALHDVGIGARVVTGADETGQGHMVCEDAEGNVIDSRYPGRLLTWDELERIGYRSARMNSLDFENQPRRWVFVAVGADGKRVYA